jgi:hypothetical protein
MNIIFYQRSRDLLQASKEKTTIPLHLHNSQNPFARIEVPYEHSEL